MERNGAIKILLVDDEPMNLTALEAILSDLDVNLAKAGSGEEALRYLLDNDVAVILMDVRMPGIDGFETSKLIRARQRTQHIPIIFLTAMDKEEMDVFRAYSIGAVDYIFKPVEAEILRSKVRVFIDLYRKTEEVKRQADEIARSYLELKELSRSNVELEQFAYVTSHDLQEPLRTVISYVQLLAKRYKGKLDSDADEFIQHALQGAQRMQKLIKDLLEYSRVATNARPYSSVDLMEVTQEVVASLEVYIEKVQGKVEIEKLPTLEAEPTQMRQLIQNLVNNALKYHRPEDPPRVKLRGELYYDRHPHWGHVLEERARIYVEDNGIGFDEKHVERIFKIFQRLHAQHEYEGTGIGLAICHKIVERHNGTITAKSQPGQGSTFIITLPVKQPRADRPAPGRPSSASSVEASRS